MKKVASLSIFVMIIILLLVCKEFAHAQTVKEPAGTALKVNSCQKAVTFKKRFMRKLALIQIASAPYGRRRTWY